TVVGNGNDLFLRPAWSPDLDQPQFLLPADNATRAVLVDAETGERLQLPIGWPAAFGARGRFAYSFPAHVPDDQQPTTFIVDLITMEVVEVAGAPPLSYAFEGDVAVASGDEGFVAVVEGDACRGTMLHVEDELPRCLDGARGAVPSPDGRRVAFSREVEGRGRSAVGTALRRYDLFVLDVDTGNERVLAPGAYSAALPPRLQWSRFGDLVLVSWPHFTGL
ncbi:MAG: TolB family protein, partial [Dehalococcoidia bacterium]